MAYGTKYRFRFSDVYDVVNIIDIEKKSYTSAVTEFSEMGDFPIVITQQGSDNLLQTIIGKEAILQLLSTTSLQWKEFAEGDNREYRVKWYTMSASATEIALNKDFLNWESNGAPSSWENNQVQWASGNEVYEASASIARFIADGSSIYPYIFLEDELTVDKYYLVEIDIDVAAAETLQFDGGTPMDSISSNGIHKFIFRATSVNFTIFVDGNAEIDVDSISIKEVSLQWSGYIDPEQYKELFLPGNQIIQVRATDGLGDLKHEYFGTDFETPYTGQDDLMADIAVILSRLGFGIDIWSMINLFTNQMNETDADDPFPQTFYNRERFQESIVKAGNCFDALKGMLSCFGARIIQDKGVWKLLPTRRMKLSDLELISNGAFTNWTADNADGWTHATEDAGNHVDESAAGGQAQFIVSVTLTGTWIKQTVLTVGKEYDISIDIVDVTSGSIRVGDATSYQTFNTTGVKTFRHTAVHADFKLECPASTAADITIDDISVKQVSIDYRVFNSSGVYQSNGFVNPYIAINAPGSADPVLWIEDSQLIQIQKGWKEFTILKNLKARSQWVWNSDFNDEFWRDNNDPERWVLSDSSDPSWVQRKNNSAYMDSVAIINDARSISQQCTFDTMDYGACSIDLSVTLETDGVAYMQVRVVTGGSTWYLQSTGGFILNTPTYLTTSGGTSITASALTMPVGKLEVHLFEAVGTSKYVMWKAVKINVWSQIYPFTDPQERLLKIVNINDVLIPADYTVELTQVTAIRNFIESNYGALLQSDFTSVLDWHHKGASDDDDLTDHLASDISALRNGPSYKLSGRIRTAQLKFASVLQESVGGSTKYFLPTRLSYNVKTGQWSGDWHEIR